MHAVKSDERVLTGVLDFGRHGVPLLVVRGLRMANNPNPKNARMREKGIECVTANPTK